MNLTRNPINVAVFLLVMGGGLVLSGQILWTLSVHKSEAKVGSGAKESVGERGQKVDIPESEKKEEVAGKKKPSDVDQGEEAEKEGDFGDGSTGEQSDEAVEHRAEKILFIMAHRSAELSPDHNRRLEDLAKGKTDGKWFFEITAYAGERSSWKRNLRLAVRRADSVAETLRELGVPEKNILIKRRVAGKHGRLRSDWRKVEVERRGSLESE